MNDLRWIIRWKSLNEDSYVLKVYDATGYEGTPVELDGGASPFVTDEKSNNDFYTPICTQSGNIEFVVTDSDVVREMMPTKATDRPVILIRETSGSDEICWIGFISGEQFSQPWDVMPYKVTVPVVSVMEAMRGVELTQAEGVTSLRSLMQTIASHFPVANISVIYPSVMNIDVQVSNQNFREWKRKKKRDELGMSVSDKYVCQSLYDVAEAFCQYFGVSLREDASKMVFVIHDWTAFAYHEDNLNGSVVQVTPAVYTLPQMVLFGDDGKVDYSTAYKRVVGTFETGVSKGSELFKLENVWENYNLYNIYSARTGNAYFTQAIFYGDTEVIPWRNGTRNDVGLLLVRTGTHNTGGQVAYLPEKGSGIYLVSIRDVSPQTAMEINMERPMYLQNEKIYTLTLDIHAVKAVRDVSENAQQEYTGRIYFQLKLLDQYGAVLHYLLANIVEGSDHIHYEWSGDHVPRNPIAWFQLKDGEIEKDKIDTSTVNVSNGLQIPFPNPFPRPSVYTVGPCYVALSILVNNERGDEWSESETVKPIFIDNLEISYNARPESDLYTDQLTEANEIGVNNDNEYKDEYTLRCPITTSARAISFLSEPFQLQSGTGIALDSQWNYISERYDYNGVVRRAALYAKPREILELPVQSRVRSHDHVQVLGQTYAVLGRNTDWRDGRTNVKIINIG